MGWEWWSHFWQAPHRAQVSAPLWSETSTGSRRRGPWGHYFFCLPVPLKGRDLVGICTALGPQEPSGQVRSDTSSTPASQAPSSS